MPMTTRSSASVRARASVRPRGVPLASILGTQAFSLPTPSDSDNQHDGSAGAQHPRHSPPRAMIMRTSVRRTRGCAGGPNSSGGTSQRLAQDSLLARGDNKLVVFGRQYKGVVWYLRIQMNIPRIDSEVHVQLPVYPLLARYRIIDAVSPVIELVVLNRIHHTRRALYPRARRRTGCKLREPDRKVANPWITPQPEGTTDRPLAELEQRGAIRLWLCGDQDVIAGVAFPAGQLTKRVVHNDLMRQRKAQHRLLGSVNRQRPHARG